MADPRRVFQLHLGLATLAAGVVGLTLLVALSRLCLKPPVGGLAVACDDLLASADVAGAAILLLCALAVAVVGRIAWTAAVVAARSRRAIRALPVTGRIGNALVLDSDRLEAFCAGYVRPRAYVSRGTVAALTPEELAAVIAHEQHHAARRDPLRSLAARALASGLFFVPSLRDSAERLKSARELDADDAAVSSTGDPQHLAAALLTFDSSRGGVAPERVDHLLGERASERLPLTRLVVGTAALIVLVAITGGLSVLIAPDSIVVSLVAGHALVLATGGALLAAMGSALGKRVRRGFGRALSLHR